MNIFHPGVVKKQLGHRLYSDHALNLSKIYLMFEVNIKGIRGEGDKSMKFSFSSRAMSLIIVMMLLTTAFSVVALVAVDAATQTQDNITYTVSGGKATGAWVGRYRLSTLCNSSRACRSEGFCGARQPLVRRASTKPEARRLIFECGGMGAKGARHRLRVLEPSASMQKRRRRSPPLPPNSAAALQIAGAGKHAPAGCNGSAGRSTIRPLLRPGTAALRLLPSRARASGILSNILFILPPS